MITVNTSNTQHLSVKLSDNEAGQVAIDFILKSHNLYADDYLDNTKTNIMHDVNAGHGSDLSEVRRTATDTDKAALMAINFIRDTMRSNQLKYNEIQYKQLKYRMAELESSLAKQS